MEVLIFAGGSGTRLKEMTEFMPKPMIYIGNYPNLEEVEIREIIRTINKYN